MPRPWTTTVLTHVGQPCGLPTLPTAAWTTPAGLPTCPHPLRLLRASASPNLDPEPSAPSAPNPSRRVISPGRFQPFSLAALRRSRWPDSSGLPGRIRRNRQSSWSRTTSGRPPGATSYSTSSLGRRARCPHHAVAEPDTSRLDCVPSVVQESHIDHIPGHDLKVLARGQR